MTQKKAAKKGAAKRQAGKQAPAKAPIKPKAKAPVKARTESKGPAKRKRTADKPVLLSGGNPQIKKGDGEAPVQAYLAAMPGWKQGLGRRLDALVVASVPNVQKAVRWNSPFYGVAGQGYFLSFHCFTKYIKVTFFQGASLNPMPPGASKQAEVRYLDLREDDPFDEALLSSWIEQAAALPGWQP